MKEKIRLVVEHNLDKGLEKAENAQSRKLEKEIKDYLIYNREDTKDGIVKFIGDDNAKN